MFAVFLLLLTAPQTPLALPNQNPRFEFRRVEAFADLHEVLPHSTETVESLALADLDGDGDLDLFVGKGSLLVPIFSPFPNGFWSNDGLGRFTARDHLVQGSSALTSSVAAGDIDGDGDVDIVTSELTGILINRGAGQLVEEPGRLPTLGASAFNVLLFDADGDGDLDLFRGLSGQDELLLNDGTGHFTPTALLPVGTAFTNYAVAGDVDGDGDKDLLLSGTSTRFLRNVAGTFVDDSGSLPSTASFRLTLGDMDEDGDLDALAADAFYENDGFGAFTDVSSRLPRVIGASGRSVLIDMDMDGHLDMLGLRFLFLGDGQGGLINATGRIDPAIPLLARDFLAGDIDGDGDADLVIAVLDFPDRSGNWTASQLLFVNDGQGSLVHTESATRELPYRPGSLFNQVRLTSTIADFDGDGLMDVAVGAPIDLLFGSFEQKTFLYLGDGNGRFSDESGRFPLEHTIVQSVAAADLDGDNDVDLVVGGWPNDDGSGGGLVIYRNGGAAFTMEFPLGAFLRSVNDVATGDVDNDGDIDILAGHTFDPGAFADVLFLNDGSGSFTASAGFTPPIDETVQVEFLDLEGDNDLDILLVGFNTSLFLNTAGVFTDVSSRLPFTNATGVAVGDVDGDGAPDLVVCDNASASLYTNDGAGSFQQQAGALPSTGANPRYAHLADLDEDGALDVVIGDRSRQGRVLLGDGQGGFSCAPWKDLNGVSFRNAAFGDLDRDGDPDVVANGQLLSNLRRHISWRNQPRVGKPLTIDVHGIPGALSILSSSFGTLVQPTGMGTFLLDPSTLQTRATVTLPGTGTTSFQTLVPSDPGLVGFTAYWQALIGNRFTNLETTTLSGL